MNGVILEGELFSHEAEVRTVRIFLGYELDDRGQGIVHARQSYGARSLILTLKAHDVERALQTLRAEWVAEPDEHEDEPAPTTDAT